MSTFNFSMSKKDAIISVKKALNGKMPILSDKNDCLTVGSPMMTSKICFEEGKVTTSASLFGKVIIGSVDSALELIDGFEKA